LTAQLVNMLLLEATVVMIVPRELTP
jgi:hypothetical protein